MEKDWKKFLTKKNIVILVLVLVLLIWLGYREFKINKIIKITKVAVTMQKGLDESRIQNAVKIGEQICIQRSYNVDSCFQELAKFNNEEYAKISEKYRYLHENTYADWRNIAVKILRKEIGTPVN